MAIWVEDQVGHPGRQPRIDRLLQAEFVKGPANFLSPDHGDWFRLAASW